MWKSGGPSYTTINLTDKSSTSTAPTTSISASPTSISSGASSTLTVKATTPEGSSNSINHVIFMLQENHPFDNYVGMLNPYRRAKGWNVGDDGQTYTVDGTSMTS